jgi:tetratricopeptide (TPR) repeat protein
MFDELVRAGVSIPDAYYWQGEMATHVSAYWDPGKATELFERVLDFDPSFRLVFEHLIESYVMTGDLVTARRLVERYQVDFPGDPTVNRAEAALLAAEGEVDLAITKLEAVLASHYTSTTSWRLELLHLMQGNWQRVRELVTVDESQVGMGSNYTANFIAQRGQAAVGEGQLGEAIDVLSEAATLAADTYYRTEGAQWMVEVGQLQAVVGLAEEAIASIREGIAIDPQWTQIYFSLGELQVAMGDFEGARQTLAELGQVNKEVVTVAGHFWESLLRAEIERAAGNLEAAEEAMRQIDAMAPAYRWLHYERIGRARLLKAAGNTEAAIEAYRAALDPRSWEGWAAVGSRISALLELAIVEDEIGDVDNARIHYQKYVDHWGNADPPVVAVPEAKARLAALGG